MQTSVVEVSGILLVSPYSRAPANLEKHLYCLVRVQIALVKNRKFFTATAGRGSAYMETFCVVKLVHKRMSVYATVSGAFTVEALSAGVLRKLAAAGRTPPNEVLRHP